MKITELSEFLEIKEQYDAETELVKQLEKKPLSNAQINDMLTRGLNKEEAKKMCELFGWVGGKKGRGQTESHAKGSEKLKLEVFPPWTSMTVDAIFS